MIYIYTDQSHSNAHAQIAVNDVFPDADVRFCTSSMIQQGCLDNTSLLIMPGGADLYYCEKLNGDGNKIIRDFVSNGGSYLGLCAGAYYGCSSLNWNMCEIAGSRELSLYEGCATGPVFDWIENSDSIYKGSWKSSVKIETNGSLSFQSLYDGGPVISEPINNNSNVIARYTDLLDTPPAIIGGTFEEGRYVLSSPHIEKFGHLLSDGLYRLHNKSYARELNVIKDLLPYERHQKDFFKSVLERLL